MKKWGGSFSTLSICVEIITFEWKQPINRSQKTICFKWLFGRLLVELSEPKFTRIYSPSRNAKARNNQKQKFHNDFRLVFQFWSVPRSREPVYFRTLDGNFIWLDGDPPTNERRLRTIPFELFWFSVFSTCKWFEKQNNRWEKWQKYPRIQKFVAEVPRNF